MTKTCILCNNDFKPVKYGARRQHCFKCLPSYGLGAPDRKTLIRQVLKRKIVEYKGGKCYICGYNKYIGSLHLHHKDSSEKKFNIGSYESTRWEDLRVEADKCDLICMNCHMEHHYDISSD